MFNLLVNIYIIGFVVLKCGYFILQSIHIESGGGLDRVLFFTIQSQTKKQKYMHTQTPNNETKHNFKVKQKDMACSLGAHPSTYTE